ncbi:acyl carrier protein [Clostridium sp. DJ247]|uniref:acyl carrier protein n=1 Tax=Clostridium sp. DJ247 TaxID=2726188 RepID=UPI001624A6DA|nr:acyl carrier protein [Clostridium sp. DJ247]MBC2580938.1 acyl carrier protein [Clostridium sp. DJ247]
MVLEKIRRIMCDHLGLSEKEITADTSFEDLGVDSLDLFQIIIEIEEEFGIQIEDAESIKTVEQAVKFVEQNINE